MPMRHVVAIIRQTETRVLANRKKFLMVVCMCECVWGESANTVLALTVLICHRL